MICDVDQVPGSIRDRICDVEQVPGSLRGRIGTLQGAVAGAQDVAGAGSVTWTGALQGPGK